jgi:3-ketoacyl-CoA synthase
MDRKFKPDFSKVFDHFLLHTGGRGVIDELEASLQLNAKQAEPSKDTLWRFGNTSAASTWYILGRIESTTGLRKGELVWQLGWVST